MVKNICRDILILSKKSEKATIADIQIARDLLDTLKYNENKCVGMAANMIGINKSIIAISIGPINIAMINPIIVSKKGIYEAEEGCLSLTGTRKITRYNEIEVEFEDLDFKKQKRKYIGWIAQIIQHEIDHTNGIII